MAKIPNVQKAEGPLCWEQSSGVCPVLAGRQCSEDELRTWLCFFGSRCIYESHAFAETKLTIYRQSRGASANSQRCVTIRGHPANNRNVKRKKIRCLNSKMLHFSRKPSSVSKAKNKDDGYCFLEGHCARCKNISAVTWTPMQGRARVCDDMSA